jgi:hypothetical protein
MNGAKLARVEEMRDLGVTYTSDLSFKTHINNTVDKAYMTLGFVLRNSIFFRHTNTLITLYESLVRSVLESASIVWLPSEQSHILMIEKVQKRFARHLYRIRYGYYPYLYPTLFVYGCLEMATLEKRRDEYLCRHFYKLLHGIIHNPNVLEKINLYVPDSYGRSRHHKLFYPPIGRTNIIHHSALHRVLNLFNNLSEHVDIFNIKYDEFVKIIEIVI